MPTKTVQTVQKAHCSIGEAAEYLGVDYSTIRRLITDGTLDATQVRRRWCVSMKSLAKLGTASAAEDLEA